MCAEPPARQPASAAQHAACAGPAWLPAFHRHALRSVVIPLPQAFVAYLLSDGVFVGDASRALLGRAEPEVWSSSSSSSEDEQEGSRRRGAHAAQNGHAAGSRLLQRAGSSASSTSSSSSSIQSEEQLDWFEHFPDLCSTIEAAVQELGGTVVPKLNWSCPTDATWVNPLSALSCTNADQVVLMLKSSDRVAHDLELLASAPPPTTLQPLQPSAQPPPPHPAAPAAHATNSGASNGSAGAAAAASAPVPVPSQAPAGSGAQPPGAWQPALVLRKWYDLRPEREWRCFVAGGRLVGVCQRDVTQHFPQLVGRPRGGRGGGGGSSSEEGSSDGSCSSGGSSSCSSSGSDCGSEREAGGGSGGGEESEGLRPGREARMALRALRAFHARAVRGRFPLHDYTFDAYVATNGTVKLVDFNPVGGTTSPLLFAWEELGLGHAASAAGPAPPTAAGAGPVPPTAAGAGPAPPAAAGAGPVPPTPPAGPAPSAAAASASPTAAAGPGRQRRRRRRVQLRIVAEAAMVQPGQRAACGMPLDMLRVGLSGVQESVEVLERLAGRRGA